MRTGATSPRSGWKAKAAALFVASVAVGVSLGVILALSTSTLCADCGGYYPAAIFAGETRNAGNVTIDVEAVSQRSSLSAFSARLAVDGVPRALLDPLADNASDWVLSFHDRDGDGRLSAGDRFRIDVVVPSEYELFLSYHEDVVTSKFWTI